MGAKMSYFCFDFTLVVAAFGVGVHLVYRTFCLIVDGFTDFFFWVGCVWCAVFAVVWLLACGRD